MENATTATPVERLVSQHVDCVSIYHGRWEDVLPELDVSGFDMVLTDPPYGMNYDTDSRRFSGGTGSHNRTRPRVKGDDKPFDPEPWLEFEKCVMWGANHYARRLPTGTTLVWQKKNAEKFGQVLSDAEIGWEKGGHGVYLFRAVWDGCARETENGQHLHPTQKPVALMGWSLDRNEPKGVIDPFMGSGATVLACRARGIPCIGIECEKQYFDTTARRLRQGLLFAG